MSKRNSIKSVLTLSLLTSLLAACGGPMTAPMGQYMPVIQPPAPTTTQNTQQIVLEKQQASLPDGKAAVSMRFDMEMSREVTELPTGAPQSPLSEEKLTVGADEMTVAIGQTKKMSVEITLEDQQVLSNYTNVNWVSTNRDVASINANGILTPLREGTTKVIASVGGVATTMVVHITPGNFIWKQLQAPTQANLHDVKLVSDTEAWAVGAGGTVMHFMRGNWYNLTPQLHPITNGADLYAIDMVSSYEGWAVGNGVILHFVNGRWNRVPTTTSAVFKDIDMVAPHLGYIVGDSGGQGIVMRLQGPLGWQPMATNIERPLNSVSALSPTHVWAAGESGNLQRPGIYQLLNESWEKVRFTNALIDWKRPTGSYNIKSIKMVNSSQGWAVGAYDPLLSSIRGQRGAMFKYDAINDIWTEVEVAPDVDKRFHQVTYNAIGMMSPQEGWILGNTVTAALDFSPNNEINGNLMKTDGQNLTPASDFQAHNLPYAFNGIDIVEHGHGIIVGDRGVVFHRQYDLNYRYKRGNFGNFSGQFGEGYGPGQVGGQPMPGTMPL